MSIGRKLCRSGKANSKKRSEYLNALLFIMPQVIGMMIFTIIPVLFSLYLSFSDWDMLSGLNNINLVGIKNYVNIWKDAVFKESFWNTIVFSVATVVLELSLGIVCAVLIDKFVYGSSYFKVAFFIPYISSLVAVSVVFKALLQPTNGPVNQMLRAIGVENPPGWFGDSKWALASIILLTVWRDLGYYIIVYLAAIKGVSKELYESASIDGAGNITQFFKITLPMVRPTVFFLMVTGIIGSFKAFDQIAVTTQGGPGSSSSVLAYYVYNSAFNYYKMGYASSMAWVLFVLIFIVTALQWKFQSMDVE